MGGRPLLDSKVRSHRSTAAFASEYSSSCSAAGAELLAAAAADVLGPPARAVGAPCEGGGSEGDGGARASARTLPCTPAPTPVPPFIRGLTGAGAEGEDRGIERAHGARLGALIAPSPPSVLAATRNSYLFVGSAPRWQWSLDAASPPSLHPALAGRVRARAGVRGVRRTSSPDAVRSRAPASLHFRCPPLPRKSPRSLPLVPRPGSRAPGPRWPGRSR